LSIKLVVFDMAGTTVKDNREVESCFARACKETGLKVSEERILALQGYSKIEVFQMLWDEKIGKDHPEYHENVFVSYDTFKDILETHYETHDIFPTDGCMETFGFLREHKIKIALTTGFYRTVADIILKKIGWLEGLDENHLNSQDKSIIDLSLTSDDVLKGRPEPYMIQKAMEVFGITDPREVINVGDTPSDLESGRKAGCLLSLGVTNGTHSHEQLAAFPNDGLIGSIDGIIGVVAKIKRVAYEKI
jgi:phosphonatase-like hydrolase